MIQNIFKNAWGITKKYKFLWLFGVLVTVFGQENAINFFFNKDNLFSTGNKLMDFKDFLLNGGFALFIKSFNSLFSSHPVQIILFVIITLVFLFLAIFINLISQGSLIYSSKKLIQNKKITIKEGFLIGIKNFWPLFSVFILTKLLIILLVLIFIVPFIIIFIITGASQWLLISLLFIILIIIPSIFFVYCITPYSFCYIILTKKKALDSIKESIRLFFNNLLLNLKFAIGLFLIFILFLLSSLLISSLISLPFFLISLILNYFSLLTLSWTIMVLSSIIISGTILIVFGVFISFQYNSWVYLFGELTGERLVDR